MLGLECLFYFAMMPIAWATFRVTKSLIGNTYDSANAKLSLLGVAASTLVLPFLVPRLPQIATWQTRRTDLATVLAFFTVVAPSVMGIIAIRQFAQQSSATADIQDLISRVSRVRQHMRFYLITLAITIVLGVFVLVSIRLAVAHSLSTRPFQHIRNIQNVFPGEFVALYGAGFTLILLIAYGPAEAALTAYARREYSRHLPIDWSNAAAAGQDLEFRHEIEQQLEMTAGQRFERWIAILAPLLSGLLAAIGKG